MKELTTHNHSPTEFPLRKSNSDTRIPNVLTDIDDVIQRNEARQFSGGGGLGGTMVVTSRFRHGQRKDGVQHAPLKLLKHTNLHPLMSVHHVDHADIEVDVLGESVILTQRDGTEVTILSPNRVAAVNQDLHEKIYKYSMKYLENGIMPRVLTLGGDHSIAIGTISAMSQVVADAAKRAVTLPFSSPDLLVIWVDAHADINTPATSASGSLHGCPVSLLTGIGEESWRQLGDHFDWYWKKQEARQNKPFLSTQNLAYIGLRDVDDPEQEILATYSIMNYTAERAKRIGDMKTIVRDILDKLDPTGIHPIHLSFDVDGIDPLYMPSTGTPVENGLHIDDGVTIIKELNDTGRLISMDIVEVNPSLGTAEDQETTLNNTKILIDAFHHVYHFSNPAL